MKLRNFLYINTKILDDYVAAIDGYIYDEEQQKTSSKKQKSGDVKGGVPILQASGVVQDETAQEIQRSVKISDAAKFDKVFSYLSKDGELKYYEFLSDNEFRDLGRDDFIEVLVTPRFSKMKEISDSVKRFGQLAQTIQGLTNQQVLDSEAEATITSISALGELTPNKEISCVFNFEDNQFPMVAYLDEQYFKGTQDRFVGQFYMLCKIQKKILKGQNIKLDEIFEDIKSLPLNRAQRRNMPKNIDNPDIIRDVIHGPAMVVIPIAVYQ